MEQAIYRQLIQVQQVHWWFAARRRILGRLIEALRLQPSAVLEIGCGAGGNLGMLARFGAVCGVEMDADALDAARKVAPELELRRGWLPENLPFEGREFDLICLFDVLEHVADDRAALECVFQRVAKGGSVLVTVPAYQWLFGRHDRLHHHFRRYRARSLRSLAKQAGFEVRRIGYFNTLLFPLVALIRVAERLTGRGGDAGAAMPPRAINRLLYSIFAAEAPLVARFFFPFGVSCIALLRRPAIDTAGKQAAAEDGGPLPASTAP